ncbi:transaldolase [Raineyella antarctica]|uniref:Transaldolase n=1 Tax=Raineyella antarctica TaxID=1577474 RepID=A0A1G6GDZ5_9ACTN|nr:transaldolase [Raineyella antarctica]SDB80200.1 transaldolase [Raineyella antarctica]
MNERLKALADAGVSIWLDDLSRARLTSGNLQELIDEKSVVGVTTNPTIFAGALSNGESYAEQVKQLKAEGADTLKAIRTMLPDDVRDACDVFAPIYESSKGFDGRVSIEVDPRLANDTDETIARAKLLYDLVDRPNVLVKIPATLSGLPAISATIAAGISVNVTLIFSVERYRQVLEAYMTGLESAAEAGKDLSSIHSVASFFVSRVDTEIDKRLNAIGSDEAKALKGRAAIANARLAYKLFEETIASDRWQALAAKGANPQRPLWASTGVKDPSYDDTMYVAQLVVDGVVNTMPEKTLNAYGDHGVTEGDTITGNYDDAQKVFDELKAVGIDMDDVFELLETEGVDKFIVSWNELLETVGQALAKA